MSETTKCAKCHDSGWEPSELGGSVPCSCGIRPNLGILAPAPSPKAGEREYFNGTKAYHDALAIVSDEGEVPTAANTRPQYVVNLARAYLALRRAPRVEAGEVTEAMVEAGLHAFEAGVPWRNEREQVIAILAAALRTGGA